jgi:hypothetical protein
MPTISHSPAPHPLPLTPSLAAMVDAATRPAFRPERLATLAASFGLLPAPPTGRAILPEPPAGDARQRGDHAYVRPVARSGTRLLDLTA